MTKAEAEGRNKDFPTEMPSETQRMMVRDMLDFRNTGINPHDPDSYKCEKFYKFRDEFNKEHGYAVFLVNVEQAARITRSSMKKSEVAASKKAAKEAMQKRNAEVKKKAVETCIGSKDGHLLANAMSKLNFDARINITDPIVSVYPGENKALVLLELVGDVNEAETSNAIDFASSCDTIRHWTRVPKAWLNEKNLISSKDKAAAGSADTMILKNEIDQRKKMASELTEEDGYIWDLFKIVHLPFCVEPVLFDKHENEIDTFLTHGNGKGHRWAYFWVIRAGSHAGASKKLIFECDGEGFEDDEDMGVAGEVDDASEVSDSDSDSEEEEEVIEEEEEEDDTEEEVLVEDATAMDIESTRSQSSKSYLRNQWTEEINLRTIADRARKEAEDQCKIAEAQLKIAEEAKAATLRAKQVVEGEVKDYQRRLDDLRAQKESENKESRKALLEAQLQKEKLRREAEELEKKNKEKEEEQEHIRKALEFLREDPDDDELEMVERKDPEAEPRVGGVKYKRSPNRAPPSKRVRLGEHTLGSRESTAGTAEPPRRKKLIVRRPKTRNSTRTAQEKQQETDGNPSSQQ